MTERPVHHSVVM